MKTIQFILVALFLGALFLSSCSLKEGDKTYGMKLHDRGWHRLKITGDSQTTYHYYQKGDSLLMLTVVNQNIIIKTTTVKK